MLRVLALPLTKCRLENDNLFRQIHGPAIRRQMEMMGQECG
jgi:hypothetical protein